MPWFSANLSMLLQEHDFLDCFDAAARTGFKGAEYLEKRALEARFGRSSQLIAFICVVHDLETKQGN